MNRENTTKTLLIACVILNLVLGGVFAYGLQMVRTLSNEVAAFEKESLKEEAELDRSRRIADIVRELRPLQTEVETYFVNKTNSIAFVEYMESLSSVSDVESSITIREEANGLKLTITFNGGFDEGMHYIALIESIPFNIDMQSVHIEEISPDRWRGGITLIMPGSGG